MFPAALFIAAKKLETTQIYPSTGEWRNKIWHTYTMEYFSAVRSNEVLLYTATWMNLKSIILSEKSQTKYDMLHDSIYMRLYKKQNYSGRKQINDLLRLGVWGRN